MRRGHDLSGVLKFASWPTRMGRAVALLLFASAVGAIAQDSPPRPPDFVAPSPLPGAPASVTAATKLPVGYLDEIGKRLGLNPCDYSVSRTAGRPVNAVALIEATGAGCVVWDSASAVGIHSFLGSMNVDGNRIPVIGYTKRLSAPIAPPVLVLDLVGRPAGDISPGLNDSIQEALVQRGAIVVKPAYSGTRHRSSYPAPDLEHAVREIVEIVAKLRRASPHSKLIVIGESLGGYIAAKALSGQDTIGVDGLALIVPLVYSPDQAVQNFRRLARTSGQQFTPLWIRPGRSSTAAGPVTDSPHQLVGEYTAVSSMDLFEAYFPAEARTKSLLTYLTGKNRTPTLIAYGATDQRVGIEVLQTAPSLPSNVHLLKLDRSGHAIDAAAAERVATMMWSTFSLVSHEGQNK